MPITENLWTMEKLDDWLRAGGDPASADAPNWWALKTMESDGLIELTEIARGGGPSQLVIQLTGLGSYEAQRLRANPPAPPAETPSAAPNPGNPGEGTGEGINAPQQPSDAAPEFKPLVAAGLPPEAIETMRRALEANGYDVNGGPQAVS